MISITREGSNVVVRVCAKIDKGIVAQFFPFERSGGDEATAEILKEHFSKRLYKEMQEIRRVYYERGWNDARRKHKKISGFIGSAELLPFENE